MLESSLVEHLNTKRPKGWKSNSSARVRSIPIEESDQNWEAEQMLNAAEMPSFYDLELYPLSRGFNPHKFFKLKLTNEYFLQCYMMANYYISARLKEDAREGIISENYMFKMLALHNPEYDEMRKSYVTHLIKEREAVRMIMIETDKISDSPLVPQRKE